MRYISTRGKTEAVQFKDAVMMGLATDGGLLLPENYPTFSISDIESFRGLSYKELAFQIISKFATDIPVQDLKILIDKSYSTFETEDTTPVVKKDGIYILELFHGVTFAFKDVALQFLGNLFEYILSERGEHLTIVGATSGDTGSAAIHGVRGKKGISIFIMHPNGKTSPVQAMQMTTVTDPNVHNIAVNGTFDDCQDMVKELFNDLDFKKKYSLGAVNSINWARVLAQVVYYFYAWLKVTEDGAKKVVFSVPTGNFGDIFAGYVAKMTGLPIEKLILATNENNILTRFINSGDYSTSKVVETISPSMDIQVASNFERYLFYLFKKDAAKVRAAFAELKDSGKITFSGDEMLQVKSDFASVSVNREETMQTISEFYTDNDYLLDPHTAVGVAAIKKINPDAASVALATAHPAKFGETVEEAIHKKPTLPQKIAELQGLPTKCVVMDADIEKIRAFIAGNA